jgi:hypothetical protein
VDAEVELSVLKLRIELLEQVALRAWVSELSTTAARSRADAQKMAAASLGAFADAIRGQSHSAKGALTVFSAHVESLQSLVHKL